MHIFQKTILVNAVLNIHTSNGRIELVSNQLVLMVFYGILKRLNVHRLIKNVRLGSYMTSITRVVLLSAKSIKLIAKSMIAAPVLPNVLTTIKSKEYVGHLTVLLDINGILYFSIALPNQNIARNGSHTSSVKENV